MSTSSSLGDYDPDPDALPTGVLATAILVSYESSVEASSNLTPRCYSRDEMLLFGSPSISSLTRW